MMLIAVTHAFVLAELLIRLVVRIDSILTAILQPRIRSLDAEVIVAFARQLALSVAALQNGLRICSLASSAYCAAYAAFFPISLSP